MEVTTIKNDKGQHGFTLVELAIVMIIIGLLLGGVLKGQELIKNAEVASTISSVKGIDGAISTFRDKYAALPGDMLAPATRLQNCNTAPCNDPGDADSRIEGSSATQPANAPVVTTEGLVAFVHLAAADLISGVTITGGTVNFGSYLPSAPVGGGFWLGYSNGTVFAGLANAPTIGHYLTMTGSIANVAAGTATGIEATQAAQIDRKLDDADPDTGGVLATGANCIAAGVYNESVTNSTCSMFMRIQG